MILRFLKLAVIGLFILIFSLGFNFSRFFISTADDIGALSLLGRSYHVHYCRHRTQIPSRRSLLSTIEEEEEMQNASDRKKRMPEYIFITALAYRLLQPAGSEAAVSYPVAEVHVHQGDPPLFVKHCRFLI